MRKALQEFFPLLSFGQRFGLLGVNLVPPESDDESANIIPYFPGGTHSILIRRLSRGEKFSETPFLNSQSKPET
jgi:hypothetical protein